MTYRTMIKKVMGVEPASDVWLLQSQQNLNAKARSRKEKTLNLSVLAALR